ncbi:c-type cytochrome [Neotabrizicola shimadae]|uniref:Cytochrome c family protein n=1 Tax=Neotabrizicola shimadae TaxID=2807096 RepID=A0A8G1EDR4_9RHOB|nr:cytochrome c family protein [Neotabrizicola shimadae]QYZ70438.1 cytochrome c family protein [Neotabrizicola shimadae]
MFDTMTMTKVVGAVCGALLVFLLGSWAGEAIYTIAPEGHAGEEERAQAYLISTGEAEENAEASGEAEVDVAALLGAADAAAGEKVFGKCKACHKIDGTDGTGPHLNGVVDREKASVAGFGYSEALKAMAGQQWTPDNLFAFLENPKGYAPGTKMSFAGLPKPADRANVIAYLQTLQ